MTDAQGAVIPGADIVAKNNATSAESRAVSSESGAFAIPALNAGTYTVTVTLMGFKTVVLNDVVLSAGVPAGVKAILEVGGLEETVVVQAASEVMQTQSATVSTTLNVNQIYAPAADEPQRARLRRQPAGRRTRRAAAATPPSTACRRARSTSPSTA